MDTGIAPAATAEQQSRPWDWLELWVFRRGGLVLLVAGVPIVAFLLGQHCRELYIDHVLSASGKTSHPRLWAAIGNPSALGLALFVFAARDLFSMVPASRNVWRGASKWELLTPTVAIFLSCFALGFALPNTSPLDNSGTVWNFGGFSFIQQVQSPPALLTVAVTFDKDNTSSSSSEGVTIAHGSDAEQMIQRIGQALKECDSATIEIHGFASGSGPVDELAFEKANLEVAQRRAEAVKRILLQTTGSTTTIRTYPWSKAEDKELDLKNPRQVTERYIEMQRDIHFRDVIDKQYNPVIGNLTRRTELRIVHAGKCEL